MGRSSSSDGRDSAVSRYTSTSRSLSAAVPAPFCAAPPPHPPPLQRELERHVGADTGLCWSCTSLSHSSSCSDRSSLFLPGHLCFPFAYRSKAFARPAEQAAGGLATHRRSFSGWAVEMGGRHGRSKSPDADDTASRCQICVNAFHQECHAGPAAIWTGERGRRRGGGETRGARRCGDTCTSSETSAMVAFLVSACSSSCTPATTTSHRSTRPQTQRSVCRHTPSSKHAGKFPKEKLAQIVPWTNTETWRKRVLLRLCLERTLRPGKKQVCVRVR